MATNEQRKTGYYGSLGTTGDPSGTGVKKKTLGDSPSILDRGLEVVKGLNPVTSAIGAVDSVKDSYGLAKDLAGQAYKAFTTTPQSQREIDAKTSLSAPTVTATPVLGDVPKNPIPDNTSTSLRSPNSYTNEGVSISSPTLSITNDQKDYLDKTLEYNRRPEVIEGFARNAALSQARYDAAKPKEADTLKSRLDFEFSKPNPNLNLVANLTKRLNFASQNERASESPSFKDINSSNEGKARLQLDLQKQQTNVDKTFLDKISSKDPSSESLNPKQIVALGETLGANYDLESALNFSNLPKEELDAISSATDMYSYIKQLDRLGIPRSVIERQAQLKFKGN